jgi:hypothetical protein
MLAGVLFLLNGLISLANPLPPFLDSILDSIFILALLLTVVGLVGFHTLQKGNYRRVGQAGFYIAVVGFLVGPLGILIVILGGGALIWLVQLATLVQLVGLVLYGAATLQARVLPRWCGIGFIVALPLALLLGIFGNVLFGVIWLALGYALWSRREASAQRSARVS